MKDVNARSFKKQIRVLYQDDDFIAFDKPARLLVIPTPKDEKVTLTEIVNRQYQSSKEGRLHPCHRLDRDTSGVILYAWGKKNQKVMMEEFKKKSIQKTYIAVVKGKLKKKAGEIRSSVKNYELEKYKRNSLGKSALTRFKVLAVKKNFSIVEVTPITGRTNQIRIHFNQLGHPLLGERKYAFGRDFEVKFKRTALHAKSLKFKHPRLKKNITIQSPLPKDMEALIAKH